MLQNIWESGTKCSGCGKEFALGEEAIYGKCLTCARGQAEARNDGEDTLTAARRKLAIPGRLTLTARQLRELAALVPGEPVRKPDQGRRGCVWYSRMSGWSAERVADGLSAQEVAGLWLDFMAIGKVPPLRHADLDAVIQAIGDNSPATAEVTVA